MKQIVLANKRGIAFVDSQGYFLARHYKWCLTRDGYAVAWSLTKPRKLVTMHRLILGAPSPLEVDHRNHNKLDNRRKNLRLCSRRENKWNTMMHRVNKTGLNGDFALLNRELKVA